ncbi:Uncharacterised conserved protein UCP031279 [Striga hermonthica]|uniref:Uncharacterized conserved protein UCP031279 n=1 Tax=Striga hermonthica TaxID=68872 RepID=A0A9N7MKR3_STRHE|nr:Uncharacterised conserved protein UCP031279 [Striga hermonthica]
MKAKASQQHKFIRIITIPFRALAKARDFYVQSMMNCADRNIVGLQGTSQAPSLPKSFSVSSSRSTGSDEDYRELLRAASARSIDWGNLGSRGGPRAMPPRSISVAMGRIDEERPCCYFGTDVIGKGNHVKRELKYPRSNSHVVTTTSF